MNYSIEMRPLLALLLFVGLLSVSVSAQKGAKLSSITAQTQEDVRFRITLKKEVHAPNESVIVNYAVTNLSKRSVYIVIQPDVRLSNKNVRWILETEPPVVRPDGHMHYDYELVRVSPRKTSTGSFTIPRNKIPTDKDYSEETWQIRVSFSYLFDVSELSACLKYENKRPCLLELYDKSKNLTVGDLMTIIQNG